MLNKLFSTKYEGSRKIINILGLKFKMYNPKIELYNIALKSNRNTLQLLYNQFPSMNEEDLFCLRSPDVIFIFNKNCQMLDYKFFKDYVILPGFSFTIFELIKLDKTSILYNEHIERVKQGEFCWKYAERNSYISHSFISKDENDGEIYINSSYVKENNFCKNDAKIQHVPQEARRKYIDGVMLQEYLANKNSEEQFVVIKNLLNYVFEFFKDSKNPEKVSGDLIDCHLGNFIISRDGQFHFIDFDLKCKESLDKSYIIYFMLYRCYKNLYQRMLKEFNCADNHSYYEKHFSIHKEESKLKDNIKKTQEHCELYKKYFTDYGTEPRF